MKTIIAGSRNITDYSQVEAAVKAASWEVTEVISGGARGVDELGEWYATSNNIPLRIKPADWSRFGRAAGPIRNQEMAEIADALIAVWDGESRGTAHMIETMRKKTSNVYVHITNPTPAELPKKTAYQRRRSIKNQL